MTEARALEVVEPGVLASIQDDGRIGHMAVGVGRAGAADHSAYALATRLVGNLPGTAAIEATVGGLRVRAMGDLVVALTGAPTHAHIDGRAVAHAALLLLPTGAELALGIPRLGLRTYLAVRGGVAVDPVLGSCSTDTMSGLGPPPLTRGAVLQVGTSTVHLPRVDHAPVAPPEGGEVTLRVTAGPRRHWFADPDQLARAVWSVSDQSDRKGVRLVGGAVERAAEFHDTELPSEGMVRGAIQIPPNGEPVILLNDHPVTGGYPVIGVLRSADIDRAAQLSPGQEVRLRWDGVGQHPGHASRSGPVSDAFLPGHRPLGR
jgi:biotin-dependent carboxylase-like uncharacterized protein